MDYIKLAASTISAKFTKTPLQKDLDQAINNEEWPAPNTLLYSLASRTNSPEDAPIILKFLWESIRLGSKDWRKVYKALVLIDIVLKTGSDRAL
jgi:hypothetical protein